MAKLTVDQMKKWSAVLPAGWQFDAQHFVMWDEKQIFTDSAENENGVFYRLTLDYTAESTGTGWSRKATGRQIPMVTITRYSPGTVGGCYHLVHIIAEAAAAPESKRKYDVLVKLAGTIDTAAYFRRAAENDTGKSYNDMSDFFDSIDGSDDSAAEAAQDAAEEAAPVEAAADTQAEAAAPEVPETAADDAAEPQADSADAADGPDAMTTAPDLAALVVVGMKFEDAAGEQWTITALDSLQVEMNGGQRSLYDFGTSRTVAAVLNALGTGSRLASSEAQEAAETPETAPEDSTEAETTAAPEAPQEAAQSADTDRQETAAEGTAAETVAAVPPAVPEETEPEAEAPEEAEAPAEATAAPAQPAAPGINYEDLVRAYFTGKTAKSTPRPAARRTPEAPRADQPAEAPEAEPAPEPEAAPAPYVYGYQENDNGDGVFTEEERKNLSAGIQVSKQDNRCSWKPYHTFFCACYADRVKLLYEVPADNTDGNLAPHPGSSPEYFGFLVDENIYTSRKRIARKLSEDINRRILELVPDQQTAAENAAAADLSDCAREQIEECKTWDQHYKKEAQQMFYDGKKPAITLYSFDGFGVSVLIDYILSPSEVIDREAAEYISSNAAEIAKAYIRHDAITAEYNAIIADRDREEHRLLKIRNCISDEKTVRIELTNGQEVKVEADAVKRLPFWGYISNYNVAAGDRKHLNRTDSGRDKDITLADIKAIYHGGRVLYRAA